METRRAKGRTERRKRREGEASRRVAHSGVRLGERLGERERERERETRKGKRDVAFSGSSYRMTIRLKSGDARTEAEATRLKQGVAFNVQREHV